MSDVIAQLAPEQTGQVRLTWLSSFDKATLNRFVSQTPCCSFWVPDTGEYAIGGLWRGRPEVAQIIEVSARRNREQLVNRLVQQAIERDARAIVLSTSEAWREGRWYRQHGFADLDHIITMVIAPLRPPALPAGLLDIRPCRPELDIRPYRPEDEDRLFAVDQTSFPWLWWNDRKDFERYRSQPEVRIWTGWVRDAMVSYASATVRPGRGHLDRIAVRRPDQGKGYGRAMLAVVLAELQAAGVREVALTTQLNNQVSQALYQSVGFRRTNEIEPIVGRWLRDAVDA